MSAVLAAPQAQSASRSRWAVLRRTPVSVIISVVFIALVVIASVFPRLFTSWPSDIGVPRNKLARPSLEHWFGTDHLGRDLFSRVIHGAASSVSSALVAVVIGLIIGGLLGLLAGYIGSWVDTTLSRFIDVLLAIPSFLLAIVIVSSLGVETVNVASGTGVSAVASFGRGMRSEVLSVKHAPFIEFSETLDRARLHTMIAHVVPNASRSVLALAVLNFGLSILIIAGLSFLGYGDPPPASDWGLLVSEGKEYTTAPWLTFFPAIVIVATVLSVNRISRWISNDA